MIDWERVQELRDEVGHDDFKEVVVIFMEEVEEVISRLRDDPDPARLDADFHFLKGGALNLGFRALARMCRQGERQPDAVEIAGIIAAYEQSKAEFSAGMPALGLAA